MTNSEITRIFDITSKLIVLHDSNSYDYKFYENIFKSLRKWATPLIDLNITEIAKIGKIGLDAAKKVMEIIDTNSLPEYDELKTLTPPGIYELLRLKGLGTKSLKKIWNNLEIKDAEELLFACRRDQVQKLKGFGPKSQDILKENLLYFLSVRGYMLFSTAERLSKDLISILEEKYPNDTFTITGSIRRKESIIKKIEIVHTVKELDLDKICTTEKNKYYFRDLHIEFYYTEKEALGTKLFITTGPNILLKSLDETKYHDERDIFDGLGVHFIPPEIRHHNKVLGDAKINDFSSLITENEIKGSLHMHTTFSDGLNSLEEMIKYGDQVGYEYMLITDHSKTASYANGLSIERLLYQIQQIKELDKKYAIRVYTGIESDILSDGSLDYPDDILAQLDVVIASIHSGLRMDIEKATTRIIRAIENPRTKIIGHLTGRLLLQRQAYPVDHIKVIDACAANNVVMELNANPSRLDVDEKHINYCMKKGVLVSINPDAHSYSQLNVMEYGVNVARRGGLTTDFCLNAKPLKEFNNWVISK